MSKEYDDCKRVLKSKIPDEYKIREIAKIMMPGHWAYLTTEEQEELQKKSDELRGR